MSRTMSLIIIAAVIIAGFVVFRFVGMEVGSARAIKKGEALDSSSTSELSSPWKTYTLASGQFIVSLPSEPQHNVKTSLDPETKQIRRYLIYYTLSSSETQYIITATTYPGEVKNPDDTLDSSVQNILAHNADSENKTESKKFKGMNAVEFEINGKEMDIEGITFFHKNTQYTLSRVSRSTNLETGDFERFTNSFELAQKQPSK